MSTNEPDPESLKCWAEIIGSHEPDFTDLSRYLKQARGEDSKRLVAECDALKASNAELREQLAANAKVLSELQPCEDGPCFYCGKPTSSVAGDPGQWPLHFSLEDGIVRVFHTQCVTDRLFGAGHIRECAVKAAHRIKGPTFSAFKDPEVIVAEHQTLVNIICEAFAAPVKAMATAT